MAVKIPREMSQAGYARYRGVSAPYIAKLIKQGKLGLTKNRKINVEAADRVLGPPPEQKPDQAADATTDDGLPRAGDGLPDDPRTVTQGEARTEREFYKAKLEKLKYEKAVGRLVEAKGVQKALTDIGRLITQKIIAWPAQMAPALAAESEPIEVEKILEAATGALIDELRSATKRLFGSPAGPVGGHDPAAETDNQ